MTVQIKCIHCGMVQLNENQALHYSYKSFMTGFQCPNCNEEAHLYFDDKHIRTDKDLEEFRKAIQ